MKMVLQKAWALEYVSRGQAPEMKIRKLPYVTLASRLRTLLKVDLLLNSNTNDRSAAN